MTHEAWHARPVDEVAAALGTTPSGLSDEEATARLERYGPNVLAAVPPASALEILVAQLRSVVVLLLAAATVVSLVSGDGVEALAIAAVLVINTLVAFVTELRARRAIEALVALDVPTAIVVRGGHVRLVDARDLVPGDLVEVESGRHVPADGRLLHTSDLRVDEAPLTGESFPVSKSADARLDEDTPLADRKTMVFKGTTVLAGLARLLVTATGSATEVGRIGVLVGGVQAERTPLERRLDVLGRRLVWVTLAIAAVIAVLGALQGLPLAAVVQTAIALAVAAVPEALPAVATIALAVGVHRMARRRALVRYLPSVESLGSTTVVCTDKTRTLTSGQMTVVRLWAAGRSAGFPAPEVIHERPLVELIRSAALASRLTPEGAAPVDPVDAAMGAAASALQLDPGGPRDAGRAVGLIPFSSERKWMASFRRDDERTLAFLKGAPHAVIECSRAAATADGVVPLDAGVQHTLVAVNEAMARDGLRVLAVASGEVNDTTPPIEGLTFLGFIGLADPPAPGVQDTIARLRRAGLRTVMLTGDQRATAEAVGRSLGVLTEGDRAIDGRELDRLSPSELAEVVGTHSAFTRVTPEHKLAIVRALRSHGEIVAMLGDGINDAAALKQADVGVAMGQRGTDVAKQAAAIVLEDDRFETIAAAVEEGRVIFDNIRKFVFYLFSCNVAEVLVLLAAGLAGLPLPVLPLQLLWLNLVTDTFPALGLALEPGDPDVMRRPPRRPEEAILSRAFLFEIALYAALITVSTLGAFLWALAHAPASATTVAFMTLGLAQAAHLGNARSSEDVLNPVRAFANPFALAGVGLAVALQLLAAHVPALAHLLEVVPLSGEQWLVIAILSALPAVVGQALKVLRSDRDR
jgi:Ca2+-transporting ATPase